MLRIPAPVPLLATMLPSRIVRSSRFSSSGPVGTMITPKAPPARIVVSALECPSIVRLFSITSVPLVSV